MINEGGSKFDAKGGSVLDANQQWREILTQFIRLTLLAMRTTKIRVVDAKLALRFFTY